MFGLHQSPNLPPLPKGAGWPLSVSAPNTFDQNDILFYIPLKFTFRAVNLNPFRSRSKDLRRVVFGQCPASARPDMFGQGKMVKVINSKKLLQLYAFKRSGAGVP